MADRMLDLMLKLDAARGISGYEEEVAELMHAELAPLSDEQTQRPARQPLLHEARSRRARPC